MAESIRRNGRKRSRRKSTISPQIPDAIIQQSAPIIARVIADQRIKSAIAPRPKSIEELKNEIGEQVKDVFFDIVSADMKRKCGAGYSWTFDKFRELEKQPQYRVGAQLGMLAVELLAIYKCR